MKKILFTILLGINLISFVPQAQAQPTLLPTGELGNKIQSGEIHLSDIPLFITHFINFGVTIAGAISILFLVIGGYRYIVGGIIQSQREQGKQTIMYALIGLIISVLSWAIVNTIQLLVT